MKTKIVPVIIKEVLEKVVYVEVTMDTSNADVLDFITDKLDSEGISLTIEDFKGDQSIDVCINCPSKSSTSEIIDGTRINETE